MTGAGRLMRGFLLACLALAVVCAPRSAVALSLEEEEKLGREFVADVKRAFPLVEDAFARDYINRLGDYLARAVETKPFPFSFYLIPKNALNAFAGPGGHIFFFTGLIESMDTVDELAAVASHEMAHITARHLSHRIEQHKKLSMATLAGALIGAVAARVGADLSTRVGALAGRDPARTDPEVRDALLLGMSAAMLDVDRVAAEVDGDVDPKEIQGMIEGRHPMTLVEYARLRHHIATAA